MGEIEIVYDAPVVFTKDKDWGKHVKLQPGAIVVLPEDAVLYVPRYTVSQEVTGQLAPKLEIDDD